MSDELYHNILHQQGFQMIGQLHHALHLTVWWNPAPDKLLQVLVLKLGDITLIKADKSYYLKTVSAEGETWARDIGLLHDYLEAHFPELRISFSHFRDVPAALAKAEVQKRTSTESPTQPFPSVEQIAQLQNLLQAKRQGVQSADQLLSLSTSSPDLLSGYVHQHNRSQEREIGQLESQIQRQQERLNLLQHLQREYQHKGSAAVYCFNTSSNVQVATDSSGFQDALRAVVKELTDQHRYHIIQKLQGGRLNIHVAQAEQPLITWIEQWFGGALSPLQLERMGPALDLLRKATADHMMVTPDEPITVDGHIRQCEKRLAPRFLSTVLGRLDKTHIRGPNGLLDPTNMPAEAMPLSIGHRIDDVGRTIGPAVIPLSQIVHACVSGTTGSGKSFLARALVEEASSHRELKILVLDPRNQFAGLLVPEDRPSILKNYEDFGMKPSQARGFDFKYFAPALDMPLPQRLSALAAGRSIVSFKSMDDQERCLLAHRILDNVFDTIAVNESDRPRLLIVIDEAQLLTRRRVDESAQDAAARAQRSLDRIAREGRKYGIVMLLVSQTIKDFSHELASLRQMTTTKIFLRNSDLEIEYAADIVGDGRLLVQLPTGTALIHNANWGTIRVRVRPPYSKVYELPDAQIRQLLGRANHRVDGLTSGAQRLLSLVNEHATRVSSPLNMSQIADLAGITSRRQVHQLIDELERTGAIRTRKLPERGRPRIVELVAYQ